MTVKNLITEIYKHPTWLRKKLFLRTYGFKIYEGTGRATIYLSKSRVLKISKNDFGKDQNKKEIRNWSTANKRQRSFLATIFKYDDNCEWIIAEKITPCRRGNSIKLVKKNQNLYAIIFNEINVDPWDTYKQCGFNSKKKFKVYDYGY
jgi:hypothetical protein